MSPPKNMEGPFYRCCSWQIGTIFFFFWGGGEGAAVLHGGLMVSHAKSGDVSQIPFLVISKLYNFEIFGNHEGIYT